MIYKKTVFLDRNTAFALPFASSREFNTYRGLSEQQIVFTSFFARAGRAGLRGVRFHFSPYPLLPMQVRAGKVVERVLRYSQGLCRPAVKWDRLRLHSRRFISPCQPVRSPAASRRTRFANVLPTTYSSFERNQTLAPLNFIFPHTAGKPRREKEKLEK